MEYDSQLRVDALLNVSGAFFIAKMPRNGDSIGACIVPANRGMGTLNVCDWVL